MLKRVMFFAAALLVTVTGFALAALAAQRFPGLVTAYVPASVLRQAGQFAPVIAVVPAIIVAMSASRRRKAVPVEDTRMTPLRRRL
jgi:hypothetical protein